MRQTLNSRGFLVVGAFAALALSGCTPEGVINKTKYQGQKIVNTCDAFKEEVGALVNANSNNAHLNVAEYDNSEMEGYHLDPGQYEIKEGVINFRLAQDLEYDKYLVKRTAVHVGVSFKSLDHLSNMDSPASGEAGMLVVDRAYYDAHKDPFFMYSVPLKNDADLNGRQIMLNFSVVKYNKKGQIKKTFCNSIEVPLGPVSPACCNYMPWEGTELGSVVEMPEVKIKDESYKYRGFTGTLDLIFPENSAKYDEAILAKAIQEYIKKYEGMGFKVTSINLEGWASPGGKEDLNQALSEKRATAVHDRLTTDLPGVQMSASGKGEDWNRVVLLTKASALNQDEQSQVLAIAQGKGTNDEKEAELRKLSFWKKLVEEVLVNTRHTFATFQFDYQPDKMYVEYYPSQMPVISDELYNVATQSFTVTKYNEGLDTKKNLKVLDILIGNNKKANLYAMRSTYHFAGKNWSLAIEDIDQAQQLDQGNSQYQLASLAYKTKNADHYPIEERLRMLDMYNDLAQKNPDNRGLLLNRAIMMDKVGYISGALAEYRDILEGNEATAANLNNRGVAKLKAMRITEAETDFLDAVEKNPKLAEAYFNLAVINAYKGLTSNTIENLDKALMYEPSLRSNIFNNPAFIIMKDTPKFDKYR